MPPQRQITIVVFCTKKPVNTGNKAPTSKARRYHWRLYPTLFRASKFPLSASLKHMNQPAKRSRFIPTREQIMENRWLRWLHPFLGHPQLWHWSRRGVALGVALGVFFGLLIPVAQIPFSAAAAILLRANVPAAAASTLVTNPVTFGPVYYAAYQLGVWIYGEDVNAKAPDTPPEVDGDVGLWERLSQLGLPLVTGLAIMAVVFGLSSYFIISAVWYWRVKAKRRRSLQFYQARKDNKVSGPE